MSIQEYERRFWEFDDPEDRFHLIIEAFDEFKDQAIAIMDPSTILSEGEEDEFEDLGEFISSKLSKLRRQLFK